MRNLLVITLSNIGDVHLEDGDLPQALAYHQRALEIRMERRGKSRSGEVLLVSPAAWRTIRYAQASLANPWLPSGH